MKKYKSKSALKHFMVTAIFVAMCQHGAAQTMEDFATGLNNPVGLQIIEDSLYVAESNGRIISKIVLATKVKTTQFTGTDSNFGGPRGLTSKGDDLYIAVGTQKNISKIDVTAVTPSLDVVHTDTDALNGVEDIVFHVDTLYAAAKGANKIVKIDLTDENDPMVTDFITITSVRGLLLNGTDLYVTSGDATTGRLSKINLLVAPVANLVLTGLNIPTYMALEGNNLYISEAGGNKVVKTDISSTTGLVKADVLTGLTNPQGLAIYGDYLYVAHGGSPAGKIVKYFVSSPIRPGSFTINTQDAIDDIDVNFKGFAEDIIINETTAGSITSLAGLTNITSVGRNLQILGNTSLVSLTGLDNLVTLSGKLYIGTDGTDADANAALVNFCAIRGLVTGTAQITNVAGTDDEYFVANNGYDPTYAQLGNAATCTSTMAGNLVLNTQMAIDGVTSNFTRIEGNLMVSETAAGNITSLTSLANIVSIGGNLEIVGNTLLTSLEGLGDLVTLEGKLYIGTTDGTDMDANAKLVDFCAISNLVTGTAQITNVAGASEYFVANNGYNPTYAGLGTSTAATTDSAMDGCSAFVPAVASTNTFSKDNYRLFPNPVKDILFIKSESEITNISISSLSGQTVLKGNSGSINVRNLSKGIYFAKIVSGEKVVVEKFIKL